MTMLFAMFGYGVLYGLGWLICILWFFYLDHRGDNPDPRLAAIWPITVIPITVIWCMANLEDRNRNRM